MGREQPPESDDGKFVDTNGKADNKKMTPAEKIASVHIDRSKDNLLPELNEGDLAKIGVTKNKPELVKVE